MSPVYPYTLANIAHSASGLSRLFLYLSGYLISRIPRGSLAGFTDASAEAVDHTRRLRAEKLG